MDGICSRPSGQGQGYDGEPAGPILGSRRTLADSEGHDASLQDKWRDLARIPRAEPGL